MKFKGSVLSKSNYKSFTSFSKNMESVHRTAAQLAAIDIMNESKLMIAKNSDGEKQRRYNPKRNVNVSKPGDPPNSDTGRLINSIRFWGSGNTYYAGTNVSYGSHLEFGTMNMAPRPWLSVALKIVASRMKTYVDQAYEKFKGKF